MIKPGAPKSPRGANGPAADTTDAIATTTTTPSSASIKPRFHGRLPSEIELGFNTSSSKQRNPEKGGDVPARFPSASTATPNSGPKIGNQLFAKLDPNYRVRAVDANKAQRKRATLKQFEIRPTSSKPDENKVVKPKRNASYTLRFAAATAGSAVSAAAAVGKVGKAYNKAGESLFANKERASLPATMADLSNAEIRKIFKHVEHPKADSDKYLREVTANHIPPQSRTYPLLYLRAFVKGRKFNSEQDLCTDLMRDLMERTNLGAASDQLSKLFESKPSFDDLMEKVGAWSASPLKDKVQVLLQGAKAGFESRRLPNL